MPLERVYWPVCGEKAEPCEPDLTLELPAWPHEDKIKPFPFFRPVNPEDGSPVWWMKSKSPLDMESGVYLIHDQEGDGIYVGSSTGTSRQGNVRRTLARHWQKWNRKEYRYGKRVEGPEAGVVLPRKDVVVCVMLIPLDLAVPEKAIMRTRDGKIPTGQYGTAVRQIESWYQRAVREHFELIGQARLVEFDSPETPFD